MGGKQSRSMNWPKEPMLSASEVNRLLNAEREIYEKKQKAWQEQLAIRAATSTPQLAVLNTSAIPAAVPNTMNLQPGATNMLPVQPAATSTPPLQPAASNTPPLQLAAANTPSLQPAATNTPSLQPAATNTPSLQPAASNTPPLQPAATNTPSLQPAASNTPPLQPAATNTPSLQPAATNTPPLQPAATNAPTLQPAVTSTPLNQPYTNLAQNPTQVASSQRRQARVELQNNNRSNTPTTPNLNPKLRPFKDDKINTHNMSNSNSRYPKPVQDVLPANQNRQTGSSERRYARDDLQNINRPNTPTTPYLYPKFRPTVDDSFNAHNSMRNSDSRYPKPVQDVFPANQNRQTGSSERRYARDDLQNINRPNTPTTPYLYPKFGPTVDDSFNAHNSMTNYDSRYPKPVQELFTANQNGQTGRSKRHYARDGLQNIYPTNTPTTPYLYPKFRPTVDDRFNAHMTNSDSRYPTTVQDVLPANQNIQTGRQKISQREMHDLRNTQRRMYERKRQESVVVKAKTASATSPPLPQPYDNAPQRQYMQQPPPMQHPAYTRTRNFAQSPTQAARTRNNNETELNCPTCNTMFGLQIYQCNSGHSSCKTCKEYRRPCGKCGNDITNMRNIALEGYIAEKKVPCPHSGDGCKLVIKMSDIEFHVKECPFKELQCPLGCNWKGKLKHLCRHFDSTYPSHRIVDVGAECWLQNISNYSRHTFLILIRSLNFLFHVMVKNGKICMAIQLIGTERTASKWSYEIHVYDKNDNIRVYIFTDVCTSDVRPVANIFNEGKCVILPLLYANTFINNGGIN